MSSGSTEDILVSGAPASLDPETLTAPERRMLFFRWIEQKLQEVVDEEERADLEDCVDLFRTRTLYWKSAGTLGEGLRGGYGVVVRVPID